MHKKYFCKTTVQTLQKYAISWPEEEMSALLRRDSQRVRNVSKLNRVRNTAATTLGKNQHARMKQGTGGWENHSSLPEVSSSFPSPSSQANKKVGLRNTKQDNTILIQCQPLSALSRTHTLHHMSNNQGHHAKDISSFTSYV